MSSIRIFVCCHKSYDILPPLCEPIQCGSAVNPKINGILHDDEGENISLKNSEYCELTAHYYAWKNIEADYYGFYHYRRFFTAETGGKKPYFAKGELSQKEKTRFFADERYWRQFIEHNEIIAPKSENMGISVYEHYCTAKYHYAEDLELFIKLLNKNYPEFKNVSEQYLSQNRQYFCNMFIMSKKLFLNYCEVLFGTLNEFDSVKKLHGNFQSDRTNGYLGEIFTGIYITYCKNNGIKVTEIPRLDVNCGIKKRLCFKLFPPESRRRFFAKKIAVKFKISAFYS